MAVSRLFASRAFPIRAVVAKNGVLHLAWTTATQPARRAKPAGPASPAAGHPCQPSVENDPQTRRLSYNFLTAWPPASCYDSEYTCKPLQMSTSFPPHLGAG